jgi:polysaccharide export outer membrane protein
MLWVVCLAIGVQMGLLLSLIRSERKITMGCHTSHRLLITFVLLTPAAAVAAAQNIAASDPTAARAAASADVSGGDRGNTLAPVDLAGAGKTSQYAIGIADVIRVNVWKNADLSQTLTVDPDGFISLPLLGDIRVAGLNTNQLGTLLTAKYASYVVTPQVTVSVVDIRSRQVFVMGQVGKAGGYSLVAPLTVLQLIAQAGGLTPYAKRKGIYVLRASNGHTEKLRFNYVKVTHGESQQNIVLQPGDTVIVP